MLSPELGVAGAREQQRHAEDLTQEHMWVSTASDLAGQFRGQGAGQYGLESKMLRGRWAEELQA